MYPSLDRRTFLEWIAAAAVLGALSPAARSQVNDSRPPTVDTSNPMEIAEGVWIIRDHRTWLVPNIGIILGKDSALVIDTGLGPTNGERVLELARRLAGRRKLFLTVTHFHPEHGYGAQVFRPDATILYNVAQREELSEKGARYIDLFRKTQSPAAGAALEGTIITMPHFVYEGTKAELDLGDRKVEFHTWGLAHTRGDQAIFLPKERILFAGDLIEERMFPIFPWFPPADTEIDDKRWVDILKGFQSFNPRVIIPGHGDPGDIQISLALASHIEDVKRRVLGLPHGAPINEQALQQLRSSIASSYPNWEHPALLDLEIQYFSSTRT